jgi:hypothetical protein
MNNHNAATKTKLRSIRLLAVCCFCLQNTALVAQQTQEQKYWRPAISNAFLSNSILYVFNRYIGQFEFAMVSPESIWNNMQSPWVWDQDVFITNQFGHPYQGATYYTAARANGFNFYQSIPFVMLGSSTWEIFRENEPPSLNDFISTTLGGASLGEMLHRLYLEANAPFAALVSPMSAWNSYITKRHPQKSRGNIHRFVISSGIGITRAKLYAEENTIELNAWDVPQIDISTHIIYGNPFEQRSSIPYEHFELNIEAAAALPWYNLKLVSDGYLFSFSPLSLEYKKLTTGLSIHCDLFASNNINLFSEALDWTIKYQRYFNNNARLEIKAHTGWTIFGTSDFYDYDQSSRAAEIYRDYGTGTNLKLFFALSHNKLGKLSLSLLFYHFFIVSHDAPNSAGIDSALFADITYSFPLGEKLALGAASGLYIKKSDYTYVLNIENYTHTVKLYLEWGDLFF